MIDDTIRGLRMWATGSSDGSMGLDFSRIVRTWVSGSEFLKVRSGLMCLENEQKDVNWRKIGR